LHTVEVPVYFVFLRLMPPFMIYLTNNGESISDMVIHLRQA